MKKILYMAATVLVCASCFHVNTNFKGSGRSVQGEGPVVTQSFDLRDFDAIVINGNADVDFSQSEGYEVTLTTQENILDYLNYRVEGTTLYLETKDRVEVRSEKYDLAVKAPALKEIEVNGAAEIDLRRMKLDGDLDVRINGAGEISMESLACRNLSVHANGAADMEATVDVESVRIEVNGAGDVQLAGKAQTAKFDVNGAGDIDARNLSVSGEVKRHTAGLASIQL